MSKVVLFVFLVSTLSSCTTLNRGLHMYSNKSPKANIFTFDDDGRSIYYSFSVGEQQPETFIFFFAATGCSSLKSVMPNYVEGLTISAKVFVLNKRYVNDRSSGILPCGKKFHLSNNFNQWTSDYSEFILSKLKTTSLKPKNIVLVGVSEAALTSLNVAQKLTEITHLAIIGDGGYTMRKSLEVLEKKGETPFNVEKGWKKISSDPKSVKKKWFGNTYRWWNEIMDINPMPTFLSLDIPIFVGIGENDKSVPVESVLFLETEFKNAGKDNLSIVIYPKVGHSLTNNKKSYRNEYFRQLSKILKTDSSNRKSNNSH